MFRNFLVTAWRNLTNHQMVTLLNIVGLALGVATCLLIGVWLRRELQFDDFHPAGHRIYRLSNTFKSESESFSQAPSGPAFGAQLPRQLPAVEAACRIFRDQFKLKAGNEVFFESGGMFADSSFFRFFGFPLRLGRPEQVLETPNQIVLTEKTALRYFGRENPVGRTLLLDGTFPLTVSGVAADPPIHSHIQFDFVIPVSFLRKQAQEQYKLDIDNLWVGGWPNTYVRLADPADPEGVGKRINEIAARNSRKEWKENRMSYQYFLQPIRDIHLKSHLRYDAQNNGSLARVNVFTAVGLVVLLLACINYINLTTAGAVRRAKETAVRKVVGAVRGQLIRQFFLETLIVCTLAVSLGLVLVKGFLPLFSQWLGQPYDFPLNGPNVLVLLLFIGLISAVAGLYPAAILSSFQPVTTLKGHVSRGIRGNLIRKGLVVFQFTITIALVASILIIGRQMKLIKNQALGFNGQAVLQVAFNGDPAVVQRYAVLRKELLGHPHIRHVSKHNQSVVGGLGNGWTTTTNLKGEEISTSLYQFSVDTSYFATYDMKLVAGRFFSPAFPTDTARAVLVNEAAVRTFGWQKPENAIGKRFGKGENTRYVVGVVKDFNFESLHKPVEALLIQYAREGSSLSLKIDAAHTDEVIAFLEDKWRTLVPEVPLNYFFIDERIAQQYGDERKMEGVFYGFAGLSLLIACLGLFGLSMFVVQRKVKEIGIRKVLGASVGSIVGLLSKDFVGLVLVAVLIASPIAWYVMEQWLQEFAYRIRIEPGVFALAGLTALGVALLTVSFQALKAALMNPVKSLRSE
ncbi:ABC transporter permease [Larkinella soli]|uniref:ABC transporter permease n=1 Tax=Larkinella soli TaxID=1770527 RepID=UPI000FFBFB47|nr:ABC transporter permease [Larkinella soli]